MYGKLQRLGLAPLLTGNADMRLRAKMLPAVAYAREDDVIPAFEAIADDMPAQLTPLVDYFEDTYIGRPNRRGNGRRAARWAPAIWNQHTRARATSYVAVSVHNIKGRKSSNKP